MRIYQIISVCLLLAMGSVSKTYSQALENLTFGETNTFEVATWNIEWFPKQGQTTADSVGEIIESLDLDVYALQEIDDTLLLRQVVAGLPDYELLIHPGYFSGLAYIYKTSTVEVDSFYKIYSAQDYWFVFPRAPLVLELKWRGNHLVLINNHLKCCGDGFLDLSDSGDEETRRYNASNILRGWINNNRPDNKVILLGDLNDLVVDSPGNNVFQGFIDDSANFLFTDIPIATGTSSNWSYPSWPSHLDHILITNELFADFAKPESEVKTIRVDDEMAGFWQYDQQVSDHRPVALQLALDDLTSVPEADPLASFSAFPNPNPGRFSVRIPNGSAITQLEVLDLTGRVIGHFNVRSGQNVIDISAEEAASGLYLLRASSNARVLAVQRIVISR